MFVFRKKKFDDVRMGICILNFSCIEVNLKVKSNDFQNNNKCKFLKSMT